MELWYGLLSILGTTALAVIAYQYAFVATDSKPSAPTGKNMKKKTKKKSRDSTGKAPTSLNASDDAKAEAPTALPVEQPPEKKAKKAKSKKASDAKPPPPAASLQEDGGDAQQVVDEDDGDGWQMVYRVHGRTVSIDTVEDPNSSVPASPAPSGGAHSRDPSADVNDLLHPFLAEQTSLDDGDAWETVPSRNTKAKPAKPTPAAVAAEKAVVEKVAADKRRSETQKKNERRRAKKELVLEHLSQQRAPVPPKTQKIAAPNSIPGSTPGY